eukprot:3721784-Prymnesium_polylepis.1
MILEGEPITPCAHLDSACAHPDSARSECDSECAVRMEGGRVPHPPFATLAGRSFACQPPHSTKTRCPRVPCRCVTAGVPDGVCNGRETAKKRQPLHRHTHVTGRVHQ